VRAVVITKPGDPDVLEVADRPARDAGAGEVRIAVKAAAVNPTDIGLRQRGGGDLPAPWVPGMDAAGVVESAGPGVDRLSVGEEVMAAVSPRRPEGGAQQELLVVPAASVVPIPDGATLAQAATLPMNGLTARLAVDRLGLARGQTLGVTGAAGAVGGYVVQLASSEGIRVIAISREDDEDLVRGFGADEFVPRGDNFVAAVRDLTGGGVDAVVDGALIGGGVLPAVRDGGRIIYVRGFVGEPERGVSTELISVRAYGTESEKLRSLARLVEDGTLSLRVAETFPPDRAADAHAQLEASGLRGRLVLAF